MGHGATVKRTRVGTWLVATTSPVLQHGFTWNVLDCLQCPMVNGIVQPVMLKYTRTGQENERVHCDDEQVMNIYNAL